MVKRAYEMNEDPVREERIDYEIVVDAYNSEEREMGWYYHLDDKLKFPFTAECGMRRTSSPLKVGQSVKILRMAPEEECQREMMVMVKWQDGKLAVPLSQLIPVAADAGTVEGVEDWRYWVAMGYEF